MLGLALQMLRYRKGTFAATFIALAAGVMVLMVCGVMVESGLRYKGEPQRYTEATAVVADRDLTITSEMFGETESTTMTLPERGSVPDSLAGKVAAVPGVAAAVPDRSIVVTAATAPDVPAMGHGWSSTKLGSYEMASGAAPRTDREIAVDSRLAESGRLKPGGTATILSGGAAHTFTVSGVVDGGEMSGAPAALFFTDAQAAKLDPHPRRLDAVGVLADPGADREAVLAGVRKVADEAGAKAYADDERGLAEQPEVGAAKDLLVQAGGAFGGYAAAIIIFVVAATVGLSVRNRRRDLALLRAIAATPAQVRTLILGEVGMLAVLAAVVGVPAGLVAVRWVQGELIDRGFVPETFSVSWGVIAAPAVIAAVAVVALLSAWIAVRRTTSIKPTEALGESAVERELGGQVRIIFGAACLVGGVALILVTGAANGQTAMGAAAGMLYMFVLAVALLAPWINRAAAIVAAPVLRLIWGDSGYLAAANLRVNARGMVAVLTALVLSVGFGGTIWFLQDNLQRQTVEQSEDGTLAQHALVGAAGLPAQAAAEARRIPGVTAATGVYRTSVIAPMMSEGMTVVAQGIDPQGAAKTMDLDVSEGSLADLGKDTVAVSSSQASMSGWEMGDNAELWLGDGTPVKLKVVAVYERSFGFGDVTLANATLAGHTPTGLSDHVLISTAPGANAGPALAELAKRYPASSVTGTDQFTGALAKDMAVNAWLNKMLIAVLVAYSVLAAANTLIMAALARTRELSLLRLVGVTRGQVKRMVHAEQATLLGVSLTIGATIAAVTLSSIVHAIAGTRIPYVPMLGWVTIVVGTVVLALVATMLPIGRLLRRTRPVEGIGIRE